jgi:hypothetical protein
VNQKQILADQVKKNTVVGALRALKFVDLILCAKDSKANRKELMSSFREKVREQLESTKDKSVIKTLAVSEELVTRIMATGSVWNTTFLAEKKKITLQYFVNEACVRSATLLYSHSKWAVSEIGEACD